MQHRGMLSKKRLMLPEVPTWTCTLPVSRHRLSGLSKSALRCFLLCDFLRGGCAPSGVDKCAVCICSPPLKRTELLSLAYATQPTTLLPWRIECRFRLRPARHVDKTSLNLNPVSRISTARRQILKRFPLSFQINKIAHQTLRAGDLLGL